LCPAKPCRIPCAPQNPAGFPAPCQILQKSLHSATACRIPIPFPAPERFPHPATSCWIPGTLPTRQDFLYRATPAEFTAPRYPCRIHCTPLTLQDSLYPATPARFPAPYHLCRIPCALPPLQDSLHPATPAGFPAPAPDTPPVQTGFQSVGCPGARCRVPHLLFSACNFYLCILIPFKITQSIKGMVYLPGRGLYVNHKAILSAVVFILFIIIVQLLII
jgi:hypothetical protein